MAGTERRDPFPEPTARDRLEAVARTGLSLVPEVGGPVAGLLNLVLAPAYERRLANWFRRLGDRLERLEQADGGRTGEELRDDDDFISAVTAATLIALRNHDEEKLTALQNAVVNVALRRECDTDLQSVLLSLVDYLTPLHMRMLRFFQNPRTFGESPGSLSSGLTTRDIVLTALPEIPASVYGLLCGDLENRGLIALPETPGIGLTSERTTDLGDRFLRFISEQELG